ncbi:MAG TPA: carboxypeptidase-like regulatory domain-containing protein, partial [Pyrinomonadaceae bacterium]|nr:carboxypeptidase-like regulatory domain-containing protein [Pyrinomonadaceae bacterium]
MPKRGGTIVAFSIWSYVWIALLPFLLILSNPVVSFAQADVSSSTLKGKVIDQNRSRIAGATLTVVDAERRVARTTTTDNEGIYLLPLLQPGSYEIRVTAKGFQSRVLTGAVLTIGQIAVYDVQLQIGPVSEKVEVGTTRTIIDIERTQQSETVESSQIAKLPNLSRNFTSYIFTLPGVADVSAARVQQTRVAPV